MRCRAAVSGFPWPSSALPSGGPLTAVLNWQGGRERRDGSRTRPRQAALPGAPDSSSIARLPARRRTRGPVAHRCEDQGADLPTAVQHGRGPLYLSAWTGVLAVGHRAPVATAEARLPCWGVVGIIRKITDCLIITRTYIGNSEASPKPRSSPGRAMRASREQGEDSPWQKIHFFRTRVRSTGWTLRFSTAGTPSRIGRFSC